MGREKSIQSHIADISQKYQKIFPILNMQLNDFHVFLMIFL